jgi:hypothetical protein
MRTTASGPMVRSSCFLINYIFLIWNKCLKGVVHEKCFRNRLFKCMQHYLLHDCSNRNRATVDLHSICRDIMYTVLILQNTFYNFDDNFLRKIKYTCLQDFSVYSYYGIFTKFINLPSYSYQILVSVNIHFIQFCTKVWVYDFSYTYSC